MLLAAATALLPAHLTALTINKPRITLAGQSVPGSGLFFRRNATSP